MADFSSPTAGLPDVQDLLGNLIGQIQPNMKATQDQMGAMQEYIKTQQRDQLNIPALQFAAGLLKPTRTGSFGESLGNAGEGALGALQKQREIDLDRQSKILELTQAKGALLAQQTQMLMPFAQMQMVGKAFDGLGGGGVPTAPGGAADPSAGPVPIPGGPPGSGAAPPVPGGAGASIPDPLARYRGLFQMAAITKNPQLASAASEMLKNDPAAQAALKGATVRAEHAAALPFVGAEAGAKTGAEKAAAAPYEFLEVTNPDGSKSKVPISSVATPGARPGVPSGMAAMPGIPATTGPAAAPAGAAAAAGAAGGVAPAAGLTVAPSAAAATGLEMASAEAKKIPDAVISLEQQDQRMAAIDEVMQRYQTGAFSEPKADALAALRAVGINVKDTDTASPGAFQEFRKNSIGQVFEKLKEFSGGVRVAEIEGLGKIVTDPNLQPEANAAISAQVRGVIDWRKSMLNDYAKEYEGGKINAPAGWYTKWIESHPLGNFIGERLAKTPVMGVAPDKVPVGGLGVADRDVGDALAKGDKYIRVSKDRFVPISQYGDYLRAQGGAK